MGPRGTLSSRANRPLLMVRKKPSPITTLTVTLPKLLLLTLPLAAATLPLLLPLTRPRHHPRQRMAPPRMASPTSSRSSFPPRSPTSSSKSLSQFYIVPHEFQPLLGQSVSALERGTSFRK